MKLKYIHCVACKDKFILGDNIITIEGLKESQISGSCEKCFDAMFIEDNENEVKEDK